MWMIECVGKGLPFRGSEAAMDVANPLRVPAVCRAGLERGIGAALNLQGSWG
jgi:hypothetical protein